MKNTIFCFASLLFKKIIKDGPEAELALLWGLGKIIAKRPYKKKLQSNFTKSSSPLHPLQPRLPHLVSHTVDPTASAREVVELEMILDLGVLIELSCAHFLHE